LRPDRFTRDTFETYITRCCQNLIFYRISRTSS
jgi:hypothetical protein